MKQWIFSFTILGLQFLLLFGCSKESTEKVMLKLNLQEGNTYRMVVDSHQDISQKVMGKHVEMKQRMKMGFSFFVENVDEKNNSEIKVTFESIYFKQLGPMGEIVYDSSDSDAAVPVLAKGFAALVGQSFNMVMAPDGTMLELDGATQMLEKMLDRLDLQDFSQKEMMKKQMKSQFGDEALMGSMEKMMSIFPDKPVGIGDSWSRRFVLSGAIPMIMDNEWRLKERRNGSAIIEVESEIKPNADAAPLEMGMVTMSYSISGTQNGVLELDEASGWTLEAELDQKMKGTMKMGKLSWPISVNSRTIISSPEI